MKFLTRSSLPLAASALLPALTAFAAQPWQELAPLPAPNGGLVCGESEGRVVYVGGTNWETGATKNWLRTVHVLDPKTLQWSTVGTLGEPYAYGSAATVDGAFVAVGGSTGRAPFHGQIRVAGGKLTVKSGEGLRVPAVLSASGLIGDEMVIVGGTEDAANFHNANRDAYAWNVRTGAMRNLARHPGPGIITAASVVVRGELLVIAGAHWDSAAKQVANQSDAWAYSLKQNAWRKLRPFPIAARMVAGVALDDRHVYLAGGYADDQFIDAAFVYDVVEDKYTPAIPLPYRAGAHLLKVGEYVYCMGGEDRPKHRSGAAYRINVADLLKR